MRKEGTFSGSTFFSQEKLSPSFFTDDNQPSEKVNDYVLVCSREKDTRELLGNLLTMWGYASQVTDDLENSLKHMKDHPPSVILVDSVLPFETNLRTIHQIRDNQSTKNIPVALLSGFSQLEYRRLSLAAGANGFFVKPLDFDVLEVFLLENFNEYYGG